MFRAVYAPLLVALSFLTLLPVGVANPTDAEISRSRGWYPFVGLLYGLILVILVVALFALGFEPWWFLTGALVVTGLALLNRFLHLDGLMDFCDAMWGGRTVERRLEIMRDSRVGSFAVAGGACVLLVKCGAISSDLLLSSTGLSALLLFPMVSRWTMTLLLTVFPYGRQEGIGSAFASGERPWLATAWALLTVAAAAWLLLGASGLVVLAAASGLALLLGFWATRRLGGGLTGDCYGAANEIIEGFALVLLVPLVGSPMTQVAYGGGIAIGFPWLAGWTP